MRNPIPVLAAALLAAVAAFAGDLPSWQTHEEPWGSWREVLFTDASGGYHDLWCPWSQCGDNVPKAGVVNLYILERQGSVPYTYYDHWYSVSGSQSAKGTYSTVLSQFRFDTNAGKAVLPGTPGAYAVHGQASVTPLGYIIIVLPPKAQAEDAPKPKPTQPAPAKPDPVPLPRPRPTPTHPPKPPKPPKPPVTPGVKTATELSPLERGWMIPTERTAYDDSVDASKKPTAAALQAAYKKGRDTVAANLRTELKAPYATLVGGAQFDKIDDLLQGKNYTGFETKLKPEEYEALKKVLKTAAEHKDFVAPNAAAQYDLEMKTILGPDGNPKISEHLLAHKITEKYRAMVPAKPGTTPTVDPAAPLTDADWAKITDPKDREAMKTQYDKDFAAADTPEKKAAVNKDYRGKIDKWVADHKPATPPSTQPTSYDPATLTPDILKNLPDAGRSFCSGGGNAGAAGDCSDVMADQNAASLKCAQLRGANNDATAKAQSDCMQRVKRCQAGTGAAAPSPTLASYSKDVQAYCSNLLAGAQPPPASTTGPAIAAPPAIDCGGKGKKDAPASTDAPKKDPTTTAGADTNPCPGGKDDKKDDPHFYDNLGNGIAFGIGGLLLGSFFGGPLMILAVGLAAGVGGYYFAKANDEPKKKK